MLIKNLFWSTSSTVLTKLISFSIGIYLARELGPEFIGSVSVILALLGILKTIFGFGLETSLLVQKRHSLELYNQVYSLSIILSTIGLVIYMIITGINSYNYSANFVWTHRTALGLILPLEAISLVYRSRLKQLQDFKSIAIRDTISSFLSSSLALILSGLGYFEWALMITFVLNPLVGMFVFIHKTDLNLRFVFSFNALKGVVIFSKYKTIESTFKELSNKGSTLIISTLSGMQFIGYYSKALSLYNFYLSNFIAPLNQVFLARFANKKDRLNMSEITIPIMIMLIFGSAINSLITFSGEHIFLTLFGNGWKEGAVMFSKTGVLFVFRPIRMLLEARVLSKADSKYLVVYSIVDFLVFLSFYCIALKYQSISLILLLLLARVLGDLIFIINSSAYLCINILNRLILIILLSIQITNFLLVELHVIPLIHANILLGSCLLLGFVFWLKSSKGSKNG